MKIGSKRILRYAGAGGLTYADRAMAIQSSHLIAFWPLTDTSGTQAVDLSGNGYHGTYINAPALANAAGPDGTLVARFDSTNLQHVDIAYGDNRLAWQSVWGLGQAGTISLWFKLVDGGQWGNGANEMLITLKYNSTNDMHIKKNSVVNSGIAFRRDTGGDDCDQDDNMIDNTRPVTWIHVAMTWSETTNECWAYVNGLARPTSPVGAGAWAGVDYRDGYIAAYSAGASTVQGWMAYIGLWNTPLSAAEILLLATI